MTAEIVYTSRTGNTELLAEEIRKLAESLPGPDRNVLVRKLGEPEKNGLESDGPAERGDWIFAGFWVDRGDCGGEMIRFLESLRGQRVFLFATAGSGNPDYQKKVMNRVLSHVDASNQVAGTFMCQGKMLPGVRGKYEAILQREPESEQAKARIRKFDRALSHPDQEDLEALRAAVRRAFM